MIPLLSFLSLPLIHALPSPSLQHDVSGYPSTLPPPSIRYIDCSSNVPPNVALALGVNLTDPFQINGIPWPSDKAGPLPDASSMQCGRFQVPMDYDNPKGTEIEIAFVVLKASKTPKKGTIFFDPGGPEEAQSTAWANIANLRTIPNVGQQTFAGLEEFDVVTMDPRGYGQSAPPNCTATVPGIWDLSLSSQSDFDALQKPMKAYSLACIKEVKPKGLMDHFGACEVASDFESLRRGLNVSIFNYIGVSYGTMWGAEYCKRFPQHQGRVVLDGVLAHGMSPVFALNETVKTLNNLLQRADAWCMHNDTCPLHGLPKGSVPAAFKNVTTQAPRNISHFMKNAYRGTVTGNVQLATFNQMLAAGVEAVQTNNYTTIDGIIDEFLPFLKLSALYTTALGPTVGTDLGISGATYDTFAKLTKEIAPSDPYGLLQASETWVILLIPALLGTVKPAAHTPVKSSKPILWVTSDWDSNTPTGWVDFARSQSPHDVLLVRHGDSHGTLELTPPTFPTFLPGRDAEIAFMVNGTLPGRRTGKDYSVLLPGDVRKTIDPYAAPLGPSAGDLDPATS